MSTEGSGVLHVAQNIRERLFEVHVLEQYMFSTE